MAPRKKKSNDTIVVQPTRRSARTQRPSKVTESKVTADEVPINSLAVPDEIVVHRPRETTEAAETAAAVDTVNTSHTSSVHDEASGEKPAEEGIIMPHQTADYDMDGEDKIVAYPGSPKAATRTPIRSQRYAAMPGDNEEDELTTEQPAIKIVKVSDSARKSRSKYDKPEEMLTNPRSPLVNARLRDLLCSAKAWDLLSPEERKRVLAKFPDQQEILDAGTDRARPDVASLKNNDNFRHDATRYQENLGKGKHDPEWIRQAQDAHRKRELGMYAEYLAARFEEDWGMQMPGLVEDGYGEAWVGVEAGTSAGVSVSLGAEVRVGEARSDVDETKQAIDSNAHSGSEEASKALENDQEMTEPSEAREDHSAIVEQAVGATSTINDQKMTEEASGAPGSCGYVPHVEGNTLMTEGSEQS